MPLVKDGSQIQIEGTTTVLISFGVRLNILVFNKVMTFVFIK